MIWKHKQNKKPQKNRRYIYIQCTKWYHGAKKVSTFFLQKIQQLLKLDCTSIVIYISTDTCIIVLDKLVINHYKTASFRHFVCVG